MIQKIRNALISVSDKSELSLILKILKKYNVKIISSGGTFKSIKDLGYECTEVSTYTGFDEMLDGRVKTLHPKIHSGILFDRKKISHKKMLKGYFELKEFVDEGEKMNQFVISNNLQDTKLMIFFLALIYIFNLLNY